MPALSGTRWGAAAGLCRGRGRHHQQHGRDAGRDQHLRCWVASCRRLAPFPLSGWRHKSD